MMKSLRKRHLQVWTAWAVVLPAGILIAWLAIPNTAPVKLLQPGEAALLPVVMKSNDRDNYTVNLRTNEEHTAWQLEWKNKTALTAPSAVIYRTYGAFQIENAILVGRIEARGDYSFSLSPGTTGNDRLKLVLYDFIHEKIIDSLNF